MNPSVQGSTAQDRPGPTNQSVAGFEITKNSCTKFNTNINTNDRARLKNKMHEKSFTKHDWIFSTISNPGPWIPVTVQNIRFFQK